MKTDNETPRRIRLDLNTPAEVAIYNAMQEVEKAGADVRLTTAVTLLSKAKEEVANFVDDVKSIPEIKEDGMTRELFFKVAHAYINIEATKEKQSKLFGLKNQVIEILKGHTEIPQEELFTLFNQLGKLSEYLDAHIKKQFNSVGLNS